MDFNMAKIGTFLGAKTSYRPSFALPQAYFLSVRHLPTFLTSLVHGKLMSDFQRVREDSEDRVAVKGPFIKYVTLFLTNFYPLPLSHFVTHPESTSHISDSPFFSRSSTNTLDKSPLYKFSLNCSRGFLSGGFCPGFFCLERFVRGGFSPFPLLSEYIC